MKYFTKFLTIYFRHIFYYFYQHLYNFPVLPRGHNCRAILVNSLHWLQYITVQYSSLQYSTLHQCWEGVVVWRGEGGGGGGGGDEGGGIWTPGACSTRIQKFAISFLISTATASIIKNVNNDFHLLNTLLLTVQKEAVAEI